MNRVVEQAHSYLAESAAESGTDVLILELIREVENLEQWAEIERQRRDQAHQALDKVLSKLSFVCSIFTPDVKSSDGTVHTLRDEVKLGHYEAMRSFLQRDVQELATAKKELSS